MNTRTTLLPDLMHCSEMSVLERQCARLTWQQQEQDQQQQLSYVSELTQLISQGCNKGGGFMEQVKKPDHLQDLENGWPDLGKIVEPGYGFASGYEAGYANSRTSSRRPPETAEVEVKGKEAVALNAKMSDSIKKRKAEKVQNATKDSEEENTRDKRKKGSTEEGVSRITEQHRETSADTTTKASEVQKPDYIHVRARRGQATDSHSLAERVRREKISERMKYLQDLVPGCNKITGKAGMLDEIINYVQSLQRQVEFLSMKLATVNPRLDFNIDNLFAKEAFPECPSSFGMSPNSTTYLQFNSLQHQIVSCSGLDMTISPSDMVLRGTISTPASVPETFLDSSCYPQLQQTSNWNPDLQNFYNVTSFPSHQPFTDVNNSDQLIPAAGTIEASNLKMEM